MPPYPQTNDSPYSPDNWYRNALTNQAILVGEVRVYGFTVYSSLASQQWIDVFDADTLPGDGATPIFPLTIAANNQAGVYFGSKGRVFHRGIALCNSTTETTKTLGAANCYFDVQFDRLLAYTTGG